MALGVDETDSVQVLCLKRGAINIWISCARGKIDRPKSLLSNSDNALSKRSLKVVEEASSAALQIESGQ